MKAIKSIFVAQAPPVGKNPFEPFIEKYGVTVTFEQLVTLEPISANEFRHQHIELLDYTAVIFTSKAAIDYYFQLCHELRITVPTSMCYFCVSEIIANYLQKYIECRKRKVFYGEHHTNAELVDQIMKAKKVYKYLLVSSDVPNEELGALLAEKQIPVTTTVLYRSVPLEWPKDKPFEYDMVVVFSATAAMALKHNFARLPMARYVIAGMGTNTIQALEKYGYKVPIKAPTEQYQSIFQAIEGYLEQNTK